MPVMNIDTARAKVNTTGFLDIDVDPRLDLFKEIERLKKEKKCNCSCTLLPGIRYPGCC
jgi:hypothetical protein